MRVSWTIASVFSAAMLFNAVLCDGASVYVRSCDELPPGEMVVSGTITFLRDISCHEPRVMHVDHDLVLRSHAPLDTKNIHFVVHKGATMTLQSPGITIARDQGSTVPLFSVAGKVTFEAAGSVAGVMDGSIEDEAGVIYVEYIGAVETAQVIRYGADSVIVSKMPEPGEEPGASGRQAVELSPALKASQAAYHAKIEALANRASSSSSSTAPPSSSSATLSPSANGDNNDEADLIFPTGDFDAPGGPVTGHPSPFKHAQIDPAATNGKDDSAHQSTANADHEDFANNKTPSASPIASPAAIPTPSSDPVPAASANGGDPKHPASGIPTSSTNPPSPGSRDRSTPSPSPSPSPSHGTGHSPTSTPESSSSPDGEQQNSDEHGSDSQSNNPRVVSGPKLALKVGEVRLPPFLSGSGRSAMWPADDGSVMFTRISEEFSGDIMGSEEKEGRVATVMVAPDAGRLERVFAAEVALREEMREGRDLTSNKGTWGVWGWVTGRRQLRQDVDKAREHLGEVAMTFDDKACLVSCGLTCYTMSHLGAFWHKHGYTSLAHAGTLPLEPPHVIRIDT
eukprot:jgi/Undpi1/8037/HiC_scaffold_24.g10509.m1